MEETLGKSSWITAAPADLSWREIETDGKTNMCTAMNQSHFNFSLWGIVPFSTVGQIYGFMSLQALLCL